MIRWKDDFEAALWDSDVKKGLEEKWRAGVAVGDVLRGFVQEAKEMMPPAFLQLVAQAAAQDDGALRQLLGMEDTRQGVVFFIIFWVIVYASFGGFVYFLAIFRVTCNMLRCWIRIRRGTLIDSIAVVADGGG